MGSPPLLKPVLYIKPLDSPPITPMNIDIKNKSLISIFIYCVKYDVTSTSIG